MDWQPITPQRFKLAEGPHWDAEQQALYWVDIAALQAWRLAADGQRHWQFSEPVSAIIPTVRGDALVTLASGVYRLDLNSTSTAPFLNLLVQADPVAGNRANDARCDERGRLWLGTMQNNLDAEGGDLPLERRSGGLFRIDVDGSATQLLAGLGIVNTLQWTRDNAALLSADSLDGIIYRYPIDADEGLGQRQPWLAKHPRGAPDGSAMDAQGYLWNARWGGHCLLRLAPDGCVDQVVELPVSHPTSCAFGGPGLDRLYVTSACPDDANGRLDGAVLVAEVAVSGSPGQRFAG
ncbi:SMP-30/gluconolactonase/LRE family protein [Pseudomonas sp. HR96]|uniref:SMP-30/gluconolactonase/LRE family protein n=1 Tax=Pseudomonas sp. HR96 TaxID=1027966 RepID=UPI002A75F882|nr:SMP-30/gluconolactonase/LRE family protein [Pseudomonas sp. HR96]WPP01885.1 SMP-30/gluconolactonase/LRE family protein [Pseudomonas sp. HR96]